MHADPRDQATQIETDILRVRAEQLEEQLAGEIAVASEIRALNLLYAARDGQARHRRRAEECAQQISSLQDTLAAFSPGSPR